MKRSAIAKGAVVAGFVIACTCSLAACSDGGAGAVAATVNGEAIYEKDVTEHVENQRLSLGYEDDDAWGEYLVSISSTPEEQRETAIDELVREEVIKQGAAKEGIEVDEETINEHVNTMKMNYEDDAAWETALESAGFTEEEYRSAIESALLVERLQDEVIDAGKPSKKELLNQASMYAQAYDGMKRSSHILFAADDKEKAKEVLDQINAGTLDFVKAVKEYSTDTASAEQDGDVGWDRLSSFVSEYTTGLESLGLGEVSGLVESQFGYHIIKCTDVFSAPDSVTSMDQLPEELATQIEETVSSSSKSTALDEWIEAFKESAEIVINEMPSGVSYNVDLSKYEIEDEAEAEGDAEAVDEAAVESTETESETSSGEDQAEGE